MSKELRDEWLKFVRDDNFFAVFDSHQGKGQLLRANLWNMQSIAQENYKEMEAEYDRLAGQNKKSNPFGMKHGGTPQ